MQARGAAPFEVRVQGRLCCPPNGRVLGMLQRQHIDEASKQNKSSRAGVYSSHWRTTANAPNVSSSNNPFLYPTICVCFVGNTLCLRLLRCLSSGHPKHCRHSCARNHGQDVLWSTSPMTKHRNGGVFSELVATTRTKVDLAPPPPQIIEIVPNLARGLPKMPSVPRSRVH